MCGGRAIIPGDEFKPCAISWAKAIGSGYPLGAFWVRDREIGGAADTHLCNLLGPGSHGTTYGGSPLGCAVGLATIRTILTEGLCANSRTLGAWIADQALGWNSPLINTIRQFGLFVGFELNEEAIGKGADFTASGKPASIFVARQLLDAGLMTVPAGPAVVR